MKKQDFIFKDIETTHGASESARVYLAVTIRDGESELVIEKTITERYPVQEYEKVIDLYERLTCGSGRKMFKLEQLAHPYNPN